MKRIIICIAAIGILGSSACLSPGGKIRFNNKSNDPYTIYLDGRSLGLLEGSSQTDYFAGEGDHSVEAIQQSGFIISPTDEKEVVHVTSGQTLVFSFP